MVFYFTGTGNSLWIAKQISQTFKEPLIAVADELFKSDITYHLRYEEKLFFVYPVHSWGPAVEMMRFIKRMNIVGYRNQSVYSICSCGDDCGYANRLLSKALLKKGIHLNSAYSVIMPNNYILLPGFTTDSKDVTLKKLQKAPEKLEQIIYAIKNKKSIPELYHSGHWAFLKTYLIYPLFTHCAIGRNSFRVKDNCISCGLCEKICPTHTIKIVSGKPVWSDTCVQCVACIHRCPVRAIEYGKETMKKGRYHHPELK